MSATGGALSKRQHYTDDEEVVLNAKRPIILNGIDEFAARGDLVSRTIVKTLPTISDTGRKREKDFWEDYKRESPFILGALLGAVSEALRNEASIQMSETARMVDAWHWISAAETAFGWQAGTCLEAFRENQKRAYEVVLGNSPIYPFLERIWGKVQEKKRSWRGTASELLNILNVMRNRAGYREPKGWPQSGKGLSDKLRRLLPALRTNGVQLTFHKTSGSGSKRQIIIGEFKDFFDASDAPAQGKESSVEGVAEKREDSLKRLEL